ncbi:hypothetical protein K0C01_07660 [Salinarchaeum sp. IM2453]|uniref:hypothetical protein n=1 Tax=Salinarchaeum sp. IM2453 TaxID=2862870 RepID=UPI001C838FED|nr:hypothetical protein [Salinarchaeum sp. IM2453]QZA87684.1 hypothetical protein K0C01_07660 [Salinarchaeum sp. IM2453]
MSPVDWNSITNEETVLWTGRSHYVLAFGLFLLGVTLAATGGIILWSGLTGGSLLLGLILGLPPINIGLLVALLAGLRRIWTHYAVTNHAVYKYRRGPLGGITRIPLNSGSVTVQQDLLSRVVSAGDLVVKSGDETHILPAVGSPEQAAQKIRDVF